MTEIKKLNNGKEVPCGVVAILIGKDGRCIASASDFNQSGYGGFSLYDSQKMRAKRALAYEAMRALSSPAIYDVVDTYDYEKIMDAMCSRGGCRVETVAVWHK